MKQSLVLLFAVLALGGNAALGVGWVTPPPSTASQNSNFNVRATAPSGGGMGYLVLWKQVPSLAWNSQIMFAGYGTLDGTVSAGVSGVGYYHWQVTVTPTAPSGSTPYGTLYATATTTVGTPITAATIQSLTFTGSSQSPTSVSSVTPSGATVSVSAPAQTNAGTYNTGTVTGTGNYFGTLSNVSWIINPRSTTFALNQTSFTYTGSAQGPSVVPTPGGATFNTGGTLSAVNANNYTGTATAYGNYTGSNSNLAWTINKTNQSSVSLSPGNQTVNAGSSIGFTASGGGVGGYNWGGTSGASGTGTTKNVTFASLGVFTVTAQSPGDTNYNPSNIASVTITVSDQQAPTVPAGLSASNLTETGFTLSWSASSDYVGVTGYEVFKNGVSYGTTAGTSMAIAGLSPSTTYSMTVRACDAVPNWSAQSSACPVTTPDLTPPSVPTGLSPSNVAAHGFTLSWSASSDNVGVTGYEVFCNGVSKGTSATSPLAINGLSDGVTYNTTVRARDAVPNWSAQSSALPVTTLDVTAPSVPTGLGAGNYTSTSFTLSWSASSDNVGTTGYEVFRNGVSYGTTAATSMAITGLSPNNTYSMTVRARDAVPNWSAQSSALPVMISDLDAPSVPAGLGASNVGATSFTLSWNASTDNVGVTGYEVFKNGVSYGTTTATSLAIAGLTQLTTYSMTVRARDAIPNWSAQCSALPVTTIDGTPPSVPTGLSAGSYTSTSFTLSWSASTDNVAVTGYEVFKDGVSYGTTAGTSLAITGLTPAHMYSMTVRARDAIPNWSAQSAALPVTVTDLNAPTVPTGLAASSIAATSFTLSWTASTDNVGVTGYEVFKNAVSYGTTTGTSLAISGLTEGTTYSMTVRARDAVPNWSAQSAALPVEPLDPNGDFDGDGMPNLWEQQHGLNPNDPADAAHPAPNGKTYLLNYLLGINPALSPTSVTPDQLQLKVHQPNP